jgi:hypothetical protein
VIAATLPATISGLPLSPILGFNFVSPACTVLRVLQAGSCGSA